MLLHEPRDGVLARGRGGDRLRAGRGRAAEVVRRRGDAPLPAVARSGRRDGRARARARRPRPSRSSGSLLSLVGKGKASHIATIEADLTADRLLAARGGAISGERLDRLLAVLADARDVHWRDEPVTTSGDPVMPRAIIEDVTGGVRVRIEADRGVREVVALGVVRTTDDVLRPIGAVDLAGAAAREAAADVRRAALGVPRADRQDAARARGSGSTSTSARRCCRRWASASSRGWRSTSSRTAIGCACSRRWSTAIRRGRASMAGRSSTSTGALPIRDQDAERRLTHRLRDELNLVPGRRVELDGPRGVRDAQRARGLVPHRRAGRERGQGGPARGRDLDRRQQARRRARRRGGRTASVARGAARVAGGRRSRAAAGRWLGPRADVVVRSARRARRRSARGARRRSQGPDVRAARSRAAVRRARRAAAARARSAAAAARWLHRHPDRGGAARGFIGELRPVPAARRRLARVLPRGRARLRARRRHGPRQDDPGARGAPGQGKRKTLVVSPTSVLFNWLAETAQVPPRPRRLDLPRRAPRARHRPPTSCSRATRSCATTPTMLAGDRVGHGDPRRVADDQEPRQPGRARGVPAQGDLAADALGYADREPARRAVEPAPLHQPRPARRARRLRRIAGPSRSARATRPRPRGCASGSGRSCCAG